MMTDESLLTGKCSFTPQKLVMATHNKGKVAELRALLAAFGVEVAGAAEIGLESPTEKTITEGGTFRGNATIKAEHAMHASAHWALADDSGLCVDFLKGLPGVDSAFYGGWQRLIDTMGGVPAEQRSAAFHCVLALARPGEPTLFFEGVCRGHIAPSLRGENGFGYDPVFIPEGEDRTFAEMTAEEKGRFSARGMAARALLEWWKTHAC